MLSIDGIGANDHVHRSFIMAKFARCAWAPEVVAIHSESVILSHLVIRGLTAKERGTGFGNTREGEQEDPLMPLLFSLAIHDALHPVSCQLQGEELLFAHLDDVYVVSEADRTRFLHDLLVDRFAHFSWNRTPGGQWNRAGECPPGIAVFGEDVWASWREDCGDSSWFG